VGLSDRNLANHDPLNQVLPAHDGEGEKPHLKRVLGRWDLVLLFVVAVFNLNVVPSIAANGGVTVWLWIISLALFFWPQAIAVIELAHRYPGEGGVYLWAKEVFGDFHGFLSGWCYWTNNMLYVPTVLRGRLGFCPWAHSSLTGGQQNFCAGRLGFAPHRVGRFEHCWAGSRKMD